MHLMALFLLGLAAEPLASGDHSRSVQAGGADRPYLLHLPTSFDPRKPTAVVLALHPFATNARMMARITRLSRVADREGFIVAFPNGNGRGAILQWNVGVNPTDRADDVGYLVKVLDDIATVAEVDPKRVYATGYSNGAMMCYRLAAEIPERIAAIAPVAGSMTLKNRPLKDHPISVLHIHGTEDTLALYNRPAGRPLIGAVFGSVEGSIKAWVEVDGCPEKPTSIELPREAGDGLTIRRDTYGPGKDGAEVVLYTIVGGGHVWPGWDPPAQFLGKSPDDLKASELIWEFFRKHPKK